MSSAANLTSITKKNFRGYGNHGNITKHLDETQRQIPAGNWLLEAQAFSRIQHSHSLSRYFLNVMEFEHSFPFL
jgi:hypothetical protein